jgi:hypothetical protein
MNTFRCPVQNEENASLLLEYCDRKLPLPLMLDLERHIGACPNCQQMLAAQKVVWEALDTWEPEPVSADFNRRLFARIAQERVDGPLWSTLASRLSGWAFRGWKPAVPMAAAAMAVVAVVLLRAPDGSDLQRKAQMEPAPVDIEQVEKTLDDMEMLRQLGVPAEGASQAAQSL